MSVALAEATLARVGAVDGEECRTVEAAYVAILKRVEGISGGREVMVWTGLLEMSTNVDPVAFWKVEGIVKLSSGSCIKKDESTDWPPRVVDHVLAGENAPGL